VCQRLCSPTLRGLIVDDPDAPGGTFCHWAIFDISPVATSLGDGIPIGAHETVNDFGRVGYSGPCPPRGRPHHYRFRLLALDVARLDINRNAKCQDVQRAAERHKLAERNARGDVRPLGHANKGAHGDNHHPWEARRRFVNA
jgi:Raf kinase inhibitor-like YbhB/YbcL family protein